MSSVFHLQRKQSLPLSFTQSTTTTTTTGQEPAGIRRRLSSLSLNLKIQAPPAAAWATLRRSKSMTDYAGSSIRKWWDWGWGWILSRKPTFASDLEMNEEETAALGTHSKGTWRHVFCKVTTQLRRKLGGAVVSPKLSGTIHSTTLKTSTTANPHPTSTDPSIHGNNLV